jgi:RNA polymerase sigma-70 factor (ECF subfamily)
MHGRDDSIHQNRELRSVESTELLPSALNNEDQRAGLGPVTGVGDATPPASPAAAAWFTTTHWSIVLAAGRAGSPEADGALEQLCRDYWYPLYAYIRRRGHSPHDAQDLVQEFFARFLGKNYLEGLNAERGKFRSFLLASLNHFLANAHDRASAAKRGGGRQLISLDENSAEERYHLEPATRLTPATIFERRWALTLLDAALRRLREEYARSGREAQFLRLKQYLEGDVGRGDYNQAAADLRSSPGAIAMAVQRLRRSYRELVRAEIARTVAEPSEVEEELKHLFAVLAS